MTPYNKQVTQGQPRRTIWPAWNGEADEVQVRYSKKRGCYVAADPDYPTVRGYGHSEDEAIEDLEDKLEDYEGDTLEGALDWPDEDAPDAHRWRREPDPFFDEEDDE